MHNSKKGFTILECLIFLTLLAGVSLCAHTLLAQAWKFCMVRSRDCFTAMALYSAHDVIVRDLRYAPRDKTVWKRYGPYELIWRAFDKDIGFVFSKEKGLIRIEGKFDANSNHWHNATKSILVKPIDHVRFTVHQDEKSIHSIFFELKNASIAIAQRVHYMHASMP